MAFWKQFKEWITGRADRELDRELRAHLDLEAEEQREAGNNPDEARYAARRAFGNATSIQEDVRVMWGWTWLERLAQDLRYALRTMRRSPGLTTVAVLSLALGIGANSAIFSLLDTVLLRLLPVEKPEEIVRTSVAIGGPKGKGVFSYPIFRELRERNEVFSGMFARNAFPVSLVTGDRTGLGVAELVSGNYFAVLGVRPVLGRVLTEDDDRVPMGHPVTVLSYRYWQRRLAANPAIVGKTIRIDNYPFTVIGVAQPAFFGVEVGSAPDVWIPMMMQPQVFGNGRPAFEASNWGWLTVLGRLAPGVSESQAQAALNVTFQQITQQNPEKYPRKGYSQASIQLEPASKGLSRLREQFESPLYVLMTVVALVLLIACANVANLLLARSAARRKEIAVRLALGAGRARLIRQLLTESTLLGVLGGLLGLAFAWWGVGLLLAFLPSQHLPLVLDVHLDARVLGFNLAVSIATGLLFGLAPALRATKPALIPALKDEGMVYTRSSRRFELRKALVVAQVALSLLLLVGAGLFLTTLRNVAAIDIGMNTKNVLMASMHPELNGYTSARVINFYQQLMPRLRDLPGVQAVGGSAQPLLSGSYMQVGMKVPGKADTEGGILVHKVSGDFFRASGTTLAEGRSFGPQDTVANPKVVVINETAARDYFQGENPVGAKAQVAGTEVQVVGVSRDSKYRSVREETPRIVYLSLDQDETPGGNRTLYLRTAGDPNALMAALRNEIQALDKDLPLYNVKTFADQKAESLAQERLIATLSGFFGALALLLASIGLYGVMAYGVLRRSREIGIRISLGAPRASVQWMVLRECLVMVALGVTIGAPLSYWLSKLVAGQLFGVSPGDPVTLAAATAVLLGAAALAGYLPAWRASRVDPLVALRYE